MVDHPKTRMIFYPISYETIQDGRYNVIIVFCYDENNKRIAMRIRQPYSFFVSGEKREILQENLSSIVGATISEVSEIGRSTGNPMEKVEAYKVECDNADVRTACVRQLQNRQCKIHEINNMLTPLLKMMQERDVQYYRWMEIDVVEETNNLVCNYPYKEYKGDVNTLKLLEEVRPPPPFSIFSFDLECNSTDWDVMCDAARDLGNDIKMCAITYVHGDVYKEYCICNGPDIADFWKEKLPEDVRVITARSELHLIQLIFGCIKKFDPDVLVGHNIAGFDIPYIIGRNRLLSMLGKVSVSIMNISRLKDQVIKPYNIEWNNSAVSMSGKLLNIPGRIWVDTLILAARSFLGQMENAKLDTLAKVHLGMSKNDVSHKDMFAWFSLWDRTQRGEVSESLDKDIDDQYEIGMRKYNKVLPDVPSKITVDDINNLISMINVMNQRGDRTQMISKKDAMSLDMNAIYDQMQNRCSDLMTRWNIERVETREDKIKALWWIVARYCVHDTRIPYRVLALQNIITVLTEQSNLFCVPINDILCRGQMHAVQSSQYKYARKMGFFVDMTDKGDPANITQVGGGYVGKGSPGLKIKDHNSVIIVLDFASLYPTIIIALNICYTTWVHYDKRDKEVTRDMCNIVVVDDLIDKQTGEKIPRREHWFLKKEILPGIVPTMLDEQRMSRKDIKKRMATTKDYIMKGVYSAQEKAVKVGMNSAYGAYGTVHSYICNKGCADATTGFGRQSIHTCNEKIEAEGLEVVYNDTDSAMILITGIRERFLTAEEIGSEEESELLVKRIDEFGADLSKRMSSFFPDPMALECENVFLSFFLRKAKMYTAIRSDTKNMDLRTYGMKYIESSNLLYVKGLASVRRDKYQLYKEIYNKFLELILMKTEPAVVVKVLEKWILAIWNGIKNNTDPKKLEKYFSYNMGVTAKALSSSTATMGKWVSIYEQANKRKPVRGERFKTLIIDTKDSKHTKNEHNIRTIDWMIRDGNTLDIQHYLGCFESQGGIIQLLSIAYGSDVFPLKCVSRYYLPNLMRHGCLHHEEEE
jgi:DNA polymerase elongation subunit (family B)